MNPERILLPIDIARCPLEVFDLVNGFARRPEATVTLLHVVNLNIVTPHNGIHEELGQEAESHLEQLAGKHLHPLASVLIHVRAGSPVQQILAEARAEKVDLIILPTYGPSFWNRLKALCKPAYGPPLPVWSKSWCAKRPVAFSSCQPKRV